MCSSRAAAGFKQSHKRTLDTPWRSAGSTTNPITRRQTPKLQPVNLWENSSLGKGRSLDTALQEAGPRLLDHCELSRLNAGSTEAPSEACSDLLRGPITFKVAAVHAHWRQMIVYLKQRQRSRYKRTRSSAEALNSAFSLIPSEEHLTPH